jgi:hypothetical protein
MLFPLIFQGTLNELQPVRDEDNSIPVMSVGIHSLNSLM